MRCGICHLDMGFDPDGVYGHAIFEHGLDEVESLAYDEVVECTHWWEASMRGAAYLDELKRLKGLPKPDRLTRLLTWIQGSRKEP